MMRPCEESSTCPFGDGHPPPCIRDKAGRLRTELRIATRQYKAAVNAKQRADLRLIATHNHLAALTKKGAK